MNNATAVPCPKCKNAVNMRLVQRSHDLYRIGSSPLPTTVFVPEDSYIDHQCGAQLEIWQTIDGKFFAIYVGEVETTTSHSSVEGKMESRSATGQWKPR